MRRIALVLVCCVVAGCLGTGPAGDTGEQTTSVLSDPSATATPSQTAAPTPTTPATPLDTTTRTPTVTTVSFGTSTADSQIRVHNNNDSTARNVSVAVHDTNETLVVERSRRIPADSTRGFDVDAVEPPDNYSVAVTVDGEPWGTCRWDRQYHGEYLLIQLYTDGYVSCQSPVT